jgi:hypothetical protein
MNDDRNHARCESLARHGVQPRLGRLRRGSTPPSTRSRPATTHKAGSPGTHHPTAGDIAIADGHGNFYNGGMMGYSGPQGWSASPRAKLLGCYIPV